LFLRGSQVTVGDWKVAAQTHLKKRPILTLSTVEEKQADALPSALWALTWLTKLVLLGESRYVAIGLWSVDLF
jgi:hypothetical protein